MATTNHERVGKAMDLLRDGGASSGLGPGHRPAPDRLGDGAPPRARARVRRRDARGSGRRRARRPGGCGARAGLPGLYTACERRKRAAEVLSYNALVQNWPEIARLALGSGQPQAEQAALFG